MLDSKMVENGWTKNEGCIPVPSQCVVEVIREDGKYWADRACEIDWRFLFHVSDTDIIWWRKK